MKRNNLYEHLSKEENIESRMLYLKKKFYLLIYLKINIGTIIYLVLCHLPWVKALLRN